MADYFPTTRTSRAPSVSSAGTASTTGAYSFIPRYTPKPEPAYISASAAADHVAHQHHQEMRDLISPAATPTNDGALFSASALALLNSFLDSLLYNFLAKSRSTKLSQLRPAIMEVLKAKLGREALASADEELELVGNGDDEEMEDDYAHTPASRDERRRSINSTQEWHLESAFKRMRLRVMVFIRLGDFDHDDEEKFLGYDDESGLSAANDLNMLSSPPAVYLASVLEYLAEQSLSLAGEAAYARGRSRARRTISENSPVDNFNQELAVVEDVDVEKIALNPALGRLWRTWRKNQRSITSPASPTLNYSRRSSVASPTRSADDMLKRHGIRKNSTSGIIKEEKETPQEEIPDCEPTETDIAANIRLPESGRDVDEIEIPGLAQVIYDEGEERLEDDVVGRPRLSRLRSSSFRIPGRYVPDLGQVPEARVLAKPSFKRQRSNSVPAVDTLPWDWIPAYMRRALAKFANMSEEERLDYAANISLPDEKYDDDEDIALDAASIPLPTDEEELGPQNDTDNNVIAEVIDEDNMQISAVCTKDEAMQSPDTHVVPTGTVKSLDEHQSEASQVNSPDAAESSHEDKPRTGLIAGGAALAAAAAGATMAAVTRTSQAKDESKFMDRQSAGDDLSVQTKEVFEPDEADTARPSIELAPQPSRESSAETVVPIQNENQRVTALPKLHANKQEVSENAEPVMLKEKVSFADNERPLQSVYSPRKTTASDDMHNAVSPQTSFVDSSNNATVGQNTGADQIGGREAVVGDITPLNVKKTTTAVDSKLASPNHIASQAVVTAEARKPLPTQPPKPAFALNRETPLLPAGEQIEEPTRSAVSEASKQTPFREGPPKPLTPTGTDPANPYAMLYDDIEPNAIGVAKTSNVPIHSATPSLSAESRPWTPNRGATTSIVALQPAATNEQRNRNIPSPLRVGRPDQPFGNAGSQQRDASKGLASKTDDYDLDKPINPERFQNWNRAKESPTIPKFYNQTVPTPTTAEAQRPTSITPTQHSPKGSQGSQKSTGKRVSEEIKEREFDALLDRKETVKYTLTPEEIRDVGPYSQKTSLDRKIPTPIDTTRMPSLPGALSPQKFRRSSPQAPPSPKGPLKISDIRKAISALSPEPAEPKTRRSGLSARDARVLGGETKDFVDFIRSCAPTSEEQTQPPVLSHRLSGSSSLHSTQTTRREQSKQNMTPREPNLRAGNNDDLIDFIRRGPPGAPASSNGDREPRIPRTVAPFRSTMDSDDLGNLVSGSSPHNSVLSRPSVTDSYTSTAPLMNKPLATSSRGPALTATQPQVTRKTRRNKDPYAIDSDDDDDFTALPNKSESRTETLAEFLQAMNEQAPPPSRPNGISNGGTASPRAEPLNFRSPVGAASRPRKHVPESQNPRTAGSMLNESSSTSNSMAARNSHPALGASATARKKLEARPAGATRGFGGRGYYYSTYDLADYLRTSGPNGMGLNGNAMNGGPVSAVASNPNRMSDSVASMNGRGSPSGDGPLKKSNSARRRLWGRA